MKLEIVEFTEMHQPYFEKFNRDWIEQFFWLEDVDRYVLQQPKEAIIDKGGAILILTTVRFEFPSSSGSSPY